MTEDDWLTSAINDSDLVAELLVRLRVAKPPPSKRRRPSPPQSWTIHQRRSRTQPAVQLQLPPPNKSEAPRASPSTPLSWSGGGGGAGTTSVSGGVPILDVIDSTQPNHNLSGISRSKVMPPGETTPTKRSRKKKTLAALKEEELFLMEEQNHLKMKLATLYANCEKQRKENESLKKMKLDIQVDTQVEGLNAFRYGGIQQPNTHFEERKEKFVLPDLNVPVGEDVIVGY